MRKKKAVVVKNADEPLLPAPKLRLPKGHGEW